MHKLEQIIEPTKKSYIPTEGEFKDDKNRFDQYKDIMSSNVDKYMANKKSEEAFEMAKGDNEIKEDDETSSGIDGKKPYRLNTENFF